MTYIQYVKNTRAIKEEPLVKLSPNGNIYLNTFLMRGPFEGVKYIVLLIDERRKCFAIMPTNARSNGAYTLGFSNRKSRSTGFVAAKGFVNSPMVSSSKGKHLRGEWNEREGFLEIKL